jgi:hypothetical protein
VYLNNIIFISKFEDMSDDNEQVLDLDQDVQNFEEEFNHERTKKKKDKKDKKLKVRELYDGDENIGASGNVDVISQNAGSLLDQPDYNIDSIIKQNKQKLVDRENLSDIGSAYGGRSQGSAAKSKHSGIAAGIGQLVPGEEKIRINDQKESTITKNGPKPFEQYL